MYVKLLFFISARVAAKTVHPIENDRRR